MIETPSLRTRVTTVSVGVMVALVLLLEAFVYLSLEDRLQDGLQEVLDTRAAIVVRLARDAEDLAALDEDLVQLGIPVVLRGDDGTVVRSDPASPRLDEVLPGGTPDAGTLTRLVLLDGGASAEVIVSRGAVDATLQRTLLLESVGSLAALLLAVLLLRRSSAVVTRPLDTMVATATRIAAGERDRRLAPSDPTTELGRMAAAFDATIDALDTALTEAEEAEARSRRFLADAAHQLRTPLAGLRASAETLLAHPDGPDRHRMMGSISREAVRMTRLVDRLLRIARIDRGEEPVRAPTDIVTLARDELQRQRDLRPEVTFELTHDEVPIVRCDAAGVREALANLLDNARHFAAGHVELSIVPLFGAIEIVVRDDGPGVADDVVPLIFERFSTSSGGSGLGLPIARGIAEAHGGTLVHRDGAFVLRLPLAPLTVADPG